MFGRPKALSPQPATPAAPATPPAIIPVARGEALAPPLGADRIGVMGKKYDVAARAPAGTPREKFESLRDDAQDKHAALIPLMTAQQEAMLEKIKSKENLRVIESGETWHPNNRRQPLEERPAYINAKRQHDELEQAYLRLHARQEAKAKEWQIAKALAVACEKWLESLPKNAELVHAPAEVKLPRSASIPAMIEAKRNELTELKAKLKSLKRAPRTAEDSKAQARAAIAELARKGAVDVLGMVERGNPLKFPRARVQYPIDTATHAYVTDAAALVSWLMQDELLAKLDAAIDSMADDKAAIPVADRPKLEAELLAAMLEAERQEEALVMLSGNTIARRPDASPLAVLEIEVRS